MSHHPSHINTMSKLQLLTSIGSIILSFIASSHHWLHMTILFVLGSSTGAMASMSVVVKSITIVSAVISLGFVIYPMFNFGW